jgi:molybdenum cofactor biosynthesis enzyme MoaA
MFKKIYIEITNICNLKCEFCIPCDREQKMISISNFEEIVKKIHKYTNVVALHVKGEPLLHKNLKEILDILEKYNLKANITTNGTLIKEKLEILKKAKCIKQINFSLHSFLQNDHMSKLYLKNIFDCVDELKNITIS